MIYDIPTKGEDGLYHVRAFTDERKRIFIQLNDVRIVETAEQDLTFEPADFSKIDEIHDVNVQNAIENGESWFGRKLADKTILTT